MIHGMDKLPWHSVNMDILIRVGYCSVATTFYHV